MPYILKHSLISVTQWFEAKNIAQMYDNSEHDMDTEVREIYEKH